MQVRSLDRRIRFLERSGVERGPLTPAASNSETTSARTRCRHAQSDPQLSNSPRLRDRSEIRLTSPVECVWAASRYLLLARVRVHVWLCACQSRRQKRPFEFLGGCMARRLSRTGLSVAWRVLALALLVSASAAAQTTLGRVAGTVLDQSGGVLPGATITLTHTGTGQVMTTVSGDSGAFLFPQVPVGSYKVQVSLEGFKAAEFTDVAVAVAQEYSLTAKLSIGALTDVVTVVSGASLVSTTTPEVTSTVMQRQVLDIPLVNRDVTNLIKLQAGVAGVANRANTVINGGRPTWTQVTLDGINIQDNFIRTNSLDFLLNRPTSDNVAEFSITTSVAGADAAGGATAIRMVTPSGTNRFSGSVFEFNRDSTLAANTFFNNAAKPSVAKPELSRHQFGGRVAGPIKRDKLFFFFNYEGFRQETQIAQNLTIPANADFYNGVFRYTDLSGNVQSVNVMQLSGLSIDPKVRSDVLARIPAASNVNNFDVGNSTAARLLNSAGYRFLQ